MIPVARGARVEVALLVLETDLSRGIYPSSDPAGITYIKNLGLLWICDSEIDETSEFEGVNIFEVTLTGAMRGVYSTITYSQEPTGIDFDPERKRMFVTDDDLGKIFEVTPGKDGVLNTKDDLITFINTKSFSSHDPEDVAYDPQSGALFIVDGESNSIIKILPGINGVFDGSPPEGDDLVKKYSTDSFGLMDPEGITVDTENGLLYVVGKPANVLFHITKSGELVRQIDISAAHPVKPAGITYAPSSVKKGVNDVYIVDRGLDNNFTKNLKKIMDGKLYEFYVPPLHPK